MEMLSGKKGKVKRHGVTGNALYVIKMIKICSTPTVQNDGVCIYKLLTQFVEEEETLNGTPGIY